MSYFSKTTRTGICIACLSVISLAAAPAFSIDNKLALARVAQKSSAQQLFDLGEKFYELRLQYSPISATYLGEKKYDDQLPNLSNEFRAQKLRAWVSLSESLKKVNRAELNEKDQINFDCLKFELDSDIAMHTFQDHLMPVNQMDSLPLTLAHFASGQGAQPLSTYNDYIVFYRRLDRLTEWLRQAELLMREGMKKNIVLPKALLASMLPQYESLTDTSESRNPFFEITKNFPEQLSANEKQKLTQQFNQLLTSKTIPALKRFHHFLTHEYAAKARTSSGWSALPNGTNWYKAWVKSQTTTNLAVEDIHQLGLREVARIQSEFGRLAPQLGYTGDPKGLPTWMEAQTTWKTFKSETEILDAYREIARFVDKKLPELFNFTPKTPLEIRAEPEISRATASDHYTAPSQDGKRPGIFWAVINKPEDYASTGMKTLYLHEGKPGHHFHLASLVEMDLPKFRKSDGNVAYTEGWALYAETLGIEMGLFENDPAAYFGHLSDEMLRATRLVVDTGLHAKSWSREQAIQYIQDTLGYSPASSKQVIERYMAWPGQALGYKIGSLKITELRNRAKLALGDRFDLRQFHAVVLEDGTLPLALLETKVNRWIEKQKVGTANK